jgi:hypothetical protein
VSDIALESTCHCSQHILGGAQTAQRVAGQSDFVSMDGAALDLLSGEFPYGRVAQLLIASVSWPPRKITSPCSSCVARTRCLASCLPDRLFVTDVSARAPSASVGNGSLNDSVQCRLRARVYTQAV